MKYVGFSSLRVSPRLFGLTAICEQQIKFKGEGFINETICYTNDDSWVLYNSNRLFRNFGVRARILSEHPGINYNNLEKRRNYLIENS